MGKKNETPQNSPKTRQVRVHKTEQYIDEVPIEDEVEMGLAPEGELDPIEELFAEIDATRTLRMHVWALTEFARNGLRGRRAPGASYVTDFPFTNADVDTYRSTIQGWYPQGGMFYIEVREGGRIEKSWSEQLSAVPGYGPQPQQRSNQQPYPIIVNAPPNEPRQPILQQPVIDPVAQMERQTDHLLKMIEVVERLRPTPSPAQGPDLASNPQFVEVQARVAMMDRLIGLSGSNPSLAEKLLGKFLGEGEEKGETGPSWVSLGIELLRSGPAILKELRESMPAFSQAAPQQQQLPPYQPQPNGVNGVTAPAQQQPMTQQPAPTAQPVDPLIERWRQVVRRLVEDCAAAADLDGAINAILDLYEKVPQTREAIDKLVTVQPKEVIGLCLTVARSQEEYNWIAGLANYPAPLTWIAGLQEELKDELMKLKLELETPSAEGIDEAEAE